MLAKKTLPAAAWAALIAAALAVGCVREAEPETGAAFLTVSRDLSALPALDITDMEKFLNDLKLSPYWKVEKDEAGSFIAYARGLSLTGPQIAGWNARFLFDIGFDFTPRVRSGFRLASRYLSMGGEPSASVTVSVAFREPADAGTSLVNGSRVDLAVRDPEWAEPGDHLNARSLLGLRLSRKEPIYLVVEELGADQTRAHTFEVLPAALRHLAAVAALPDGYRAEQAYGKFYRAVFDYPLKDEELIRISGMQDRDDLYGCFHARPGTSYEGVNILLRHDVFCKGECTRARDRQRKAEYLGTPYAAGDRVFYYIEDNAVYLAEGYDAKYGTFSGSDSFTADIEVRNGDGRLLYSAAGRFRGWER